VSLLLALFVFASAVGIDFCATKYVLSVGRADTRAAMVWSVGQWSCSLVGFLIAVKITLWYLPIEAAGLAFGTWLSMRRKPSNCEV
jgi:hypothetical protein